MYYSDNFGFDTINSNPSINTVNSNNFLNNHITIEPFKGDNEDLIDWLINFEIATKALGLNSNDMFKIIPFYLQDSARKWYNVTCSPNSFREIPKTYDELRKKMILDLCPSDYQAHLYHQFHCIKQEPNQSTTNFVYQIHELCIRMNKKMPEKLMLIFIIERLLPQAKFIITLQNPQTLLELINAAKLVDKTVNSRMQKENENNSNLNKIQFAINQIIDKPNDSVSTIVPNTIFIHKEIKLNNNKVQAMFDTGSGLTLISKNLADRLNLNLQPYHEHSPLAVNNSPVRILGQVKVRIKICDDESAVAISTIVPVTEYLPQQFDVLIGQDIMSKSNIIINCATRSIHINNSINPTSLSSAKNSVQTVETEIIDNFDQIESSKRKSNDENEQKVKNCPSLQLNDPLQLQVEKEIPNLIDENDYVDSFNLDYKSNSIIPKNLFSHDYFLPSMNCYATLENHQSYHYQKDIINLNNHEPNDNVFNWLVQRSADEIAEI